MALITETTNNIEELSGSFVDAENRVNNGLKKSLILNIVRGKGVLGDLSQQNKGRLAESLPSKSYKAEENLIFALP